MSIEKNESIPRLNYRGEKSRAPIINLLLLGGKSLLQPHTKERQTAVVGRRRGKEETLHQPAIRFPYEADVPSGRGKNRKNRKIEEESNATVTSSTGIK